MDKVNEIMVHYIWSYIPDLMLLGYDGGANMRGSLSPSPYYKKTEFMRVRALLGSFLKLSLSEYM